MLVYADSVAVYVLLVCTFVCSHFIAVIVHVIYFFFLFFVFF